MAGKLLEKKKLKRKKILESGLSLFIDNHIHDVSVKDIADKAGVGNGTFYLYFKDKFALRDTLIQNIGNEMFYKAVTALEQKEDSKNFEEAVIFIIDHVIHQLMGNLKVLRFIEKNLSYGISIDQLHDAFPNDFRSIEEDFLIRSKQMNYELNNASTILYLIIELAGTACYSSILFNDPLPIEDLKPILYNSIKAILASAKKEN